MPVSMLVKWKSTVYDEKVFGAVLTNLLKAFDCLSHDRLVAKFNAYGFSMFDLFIIT